MSSLYLSSPPSRWPLLGEGRISHRQSLPHNKVLQVQPSQSLMKAKKEFAKEIASLFLQDLSSQVWRSMSTPASASFSSFSTWKRVSVSAGFSWLFFLKQNYLIPSISRETSAWSTKARYWPNLFTPCLQNRDIVDLRRWKGAKTFLSLVKHGSRGVRLLLSSSSGGLAH